MVATGLDLDPQLGALLGESTTEIEVARKNRVFCNRNLRMDTIEMIGFDMDYTLALYHQERLERLSIELTLRKLIDNYGYPEPIKDLHYDPKWAIRGVVVDRQNGNIFKMDRHAYVGRCYHGFRELTTDERKATYRNEKINLSSDRYEWIDTLFGLPEAVMYTTLVDWADKQTGTVDYDKLFGDIRTAIDEAHRDDTLKSVIKADLPSFIVKDPMLGETLHKFRSSGKKLFVLTNSLYDYTNSVMSYLLDGERKAYPSWRNYFDIVMVGGAKPAFFNEQRPFVQIDPATGEPITNGEIKHLSRDKVYQGGNIIAFEQMSAIRGEQVLYIGDHIYGDILRLRKQHMWRTALVLQELEREISVSDRLEAQIRDLDLLDRRHRNLESEIDYQSLRLKKIQRLLDDPTCSAPLRTRLEEERRQTRNSVDSLRDRAGLMDSEVDSLESRIDRAFNPHWGSCLREGNENSRFGEQVNDYADLYTSRVSNFAPYSPLRYFRAPRRPMPHEI
ncbi:MAG: HAD-IG family 5'-nucleotidase [Deltaproteobacteria bacterium]|nr:HAD-IG family 5'-nucleotidase [Deltaproteobacteria bacterium]MCW5804833.1 HAD-IG family 5'-nucleotidase [Deltaproteobacteria bacterium]